MLVHAPGDRATLLVKQPWRTRDGREIPVVQPVHPVNLGVEAEEGPPLKPGEVLQSCKPSFRHTPVKFEDSGERGLAREMLLVCAGGRRLRVVALEIP